MQTTKQSISVATDCVVFGFDGRELKVLLIERGIEPYKGMWAFPGGFMHSDETAEQCAIRELKEETGLELTKVRQLGVFSGVNRDPRARIISIAFYALARQSEVVGGDDAANARWWPITDVPQLAFDHDYILRQAMNRIRQDIHFEPVGFGLLEDLFTIADLQRLYECILGVHFDRRNFYRKMIQTGILQEVDEEEELRERNVGRKRRPSEMLHYVSAPKQEYFGSNREMKRKDINSLFGDVEKENNVFDAFQQDDEPIDNSEFFSEAQESTRPHQVGRKGKLFRFDKESYDKLKDNDSLRLEF